VQPTGSESRHKQTLQFPESQQKASLGVGFSGEGNIARCRALASTLALIVPMSIPNKGQRGAITLQVSRSKRDVHLP